MKIPLALALGAILIVLTTFGAVMSLSIDEHGMAARCPMLGMTKSFCVDVAAHLREWQQTFTATGTDGLVGLLMALGMILVVVGYFFTTDVIFTAVTQRIHSRGDPEKRLFDYQALQFSNGILHPKIF